MTGLLGLFGTVAFVSGIKTIDKLPKERNLWLTPANTLVGDVKFIVVVAFALVVLATVFTTLAAGDLVTRTAKSDSPTKFRNRSLAAAETSMKLLWLGESRLKGPAQASQSRGRR